MAVPVHVEINPPITESAELPLTAKLLRANDIVDQLKQTSPDVICLIHRLRQNVSAYERDIAQRDLREKIEAALYQGGIGIEIASAFAPMVAYNMVTDIEIVKVKYGD